MSVYSFNTVLLSAQKTGSPAKLNTLTQSSGVSAIQLSTFDVGIAFTPVTPLLGDILTVTVLGSTFYIDKAYSGSTFALVTTSGYSVFTFLSSVLVPPVSSVVGELNVSTPETRRQYYLGIK